MYGYVQTLSVLVKSPRATPEFLNFKRRDGRTVLTALVWKTFRNPRSDREGQSSPSTEFLQALALLLNHGAQVDVADRGNAIVWALQALLINAPDVIPQIYPWGRNAIESLAALRTKVNAVVVLNMMLLACGNFVDENEADDLCETLAPNFVSVASIFHAFLSPILHHCVRSVRSRRLNYSRAPCRILWTFRRQTPDFFINQPQLSHAFCTIFGSEGIMRLISSYDGWILLGLSPSIVFPGRY